MTMQAMHFGFQLAGIESTLGEPTGNVARRGDQAQQQVLGGQHQRPRIVDQQALGRLQAGQPLGRESQGSGRLGLGQGRQFEAALHSREVDALGGSQQGGAALGLGQQAQQDLGGVQPSGSAQLVQPAAIRSARSAAGVKSNCMSLI